LGSSIAILLSPSASDYTDMSVMSNRVCEGFYQFIAIELAD